MPGSHGFDPSPQELLNIRSSECGYRELHNWSVSVVWDDLTIVLPTKCDYMPPQARWQVFNGFQATRWTSQHWEIPLVAAVLYLIMIVSLKHVMSTRQPIYLQPIVLTWNFGLSLFSMAGMLYTVPQLLYGEDVGLNTGGWYPSVCAHASSYGMGESGIFVALFIYSKLAELLDTFFLLLRKSPVILLHWYHHVTVLLFCWHAYSVRIGSGLWFAAMNYSVHSLMYLYYGVTQTGPKGRKLAKKVAIVITSFQLLQMVVGILVTVYSVVYHAQGKPCYVNLTNSFLGLLMYSSYFILFLQLFLTHYVWKKPSEQQHHSPGNESSAAPDASMQQADSASKPFVRPKKSE